ncbi:MAG: alpha-N-acetylglucosaminidase [Tannerellaceae bacterium]
MKNKLIMLCMVLLANMAVYAQTQSSYDLIERITPGYSDQFTIEINPDNNGGEDYFEIGSKDGKVLLKGNNPVSVATAFNWYLKYYCKCQISWFGDQLYLPKKLVRPTAIERKTINGKYRVNFNYCTISYTAPWWDWKRWEREIDFMAMNSINTPLQTIGLDAVWYHTLLDMGFTDNEARSFLVTPAHQAWQWMPNIESIGGGLPLSWIESHKDLARKIYARQVELGMQPIQQAFTGYVPKLLKDKYPDAKIAQQPEWYGFEGVSQLDPLDPLFKTMGAKFMENQKKLFGNYGMYAADPFHESTPPDNSDAYLEKVGAVIYNVIKESDPNAMVAMQSWSIRKPILEQFPKDSIIVLCLNGGRNDFWGYNFIAGNLHNFGGRINMHGDLNLVASNQYVDAVNKTPNAIGSGLFMESIVQNPVYYALAYEMPLYEGAIDCKDWLDAYTERAYGAKSENAQKAWHILLESAYGKGTNGVEYSSVIAARPAINVKKSGPNAGFKIPYDEQALYKAQALLLADANKLGKSKLYRFDIVDVQRQIMTNLAQRINKAATAAYKAGDLKTFRLHRDRFLELLLDTDKMLVSRTEWNFDKWVNDARSWGTTSKEKDQLEEDATSLVTFWGFTEGYNCIQFDYSWREWAGLIRRYYYPRWKKLYDVMETSLAKGEPYNDDNAKQNHGREAFRGNEFYSDLADWEIAFSKTPKTDINPNPKGDEVKLAKQMFEKYSKINTLYLQDSAANSAISTDGNFEYKN